MISPGNDYGCRNTATVVTRQSFVSGMLWSAPEILRRGSQAITAKSDVFSFAIILHEVCSRQPPWGAGPFDPKGAHSS